MTNWAAGMAITTARLIDSTWSDLQTYTPAVAGGGSLAFSTQSGQYRTAGKLVWVSIYLVANAAATGTGNVTITTPTSPDRTNRQELVGMASVWGGGNGLRLVSMVAFTGGSGAIWDAVYTTQNTASDMVRAMSSTGATWPSGALLAIQGTYLSA